MCRLTIFTGSVILCCLPLSPALACLSDDGCLMAENLRAELEPAEACIILRIDSEVCDCQSWVSLENNCSVNFKAQDFTFGKCMIDGQVKIDCPTVISPGSWGSVFFPTSESFALGAHEENLHLALSGNEIILAVNYDLAEVETGCACGRQAQGWSGPGLALLLAALMLSLRVRRPGC